MGINARCLSKNTARNIAPVTENVKYRHAVHCYWADKEYGERMCRAMKLDMKKVLKLAEGDQKSLIAATLE